MFGGGVEEANSFLIPGGIFFADGFVGIDERLEIELERFAKVILLGVGIGFGRQIGEGARGEQDERQRESEARQSSHESSLKNGRGIVADWGRGGQWKKRRVLIIAGGGL